MNDQHQDSVSDRDQSTECSQNQIKAQCVIGSLDLYVTKTRAHCVSRDRAQCMSRIQDDDLIHD